MYKNYNMNQITLSLETEIMIPDNDISKAIHMLVESMPEDVFNGFRQSQGASSYHPKMMLKILLCAYSQSAFSGRKIEALLQDSIRMMWLAQNQIPSYRRINRFRAHPKMVALLQSAFIQFRYQLESNDLIESDAIFIDNHPFFHSMFSPSQYTLSQYTEKWFLVCKLLCLIWRELLSLNCGKLLSLV